MQNPEAITMRQNNNGERMADTKGKITDEDIARQEEVVGLFEPSPHREFHAQVSADSIRNFALSVGDDNPLYTDPVYAKTTRWGSVIAPSIMTAIINEPLKGDRIPSEVRKRARGLFKGCQIFMSGGTWNWYRPMYPGDTIHSFEGEESCEVKESEFGGRTVHVIRRYVKLNQRGEVVGIYRALRIMAERDTARKKGKYADIEAASWDKDQISDIDQRYLTESPQGGTPRWFEDVTEGETFGPIQKGPLTMTDMVLTHVAGYGFAPQRMLATSRVAAKDRDRMPYMYSRNAQGVPDTEARVHWDGELAKKVGNPQAYDWGLLREFWLHHALTDFAGDDGFVLKQRDEIRKFNYMGDLQILTGEVERSYAEGHQHLVDVRVAAENQRGEETAFAEATIALPSKEHGPVVLPPVPQDLQSQATSFLAEHHRRSAI